MFIFEFLYIRFYGTDLHDYDIVPAFRGFILKEVLCVCQVVAGGKWGKHPGV